MSTRWKQDFPIFNSEDSYVTRREFTKFLGLTSVAFLAGTLAAAGRKLVQRIFSREESAVAVAGIDDIPVGGHKLFRYPTENDPCILIRLSEDKFAAFDQRCTHLSCPVLFDATNKQLACPCHQGFFSAEDGRPLAGPPKRPLTQFTVTTQNAQVVVSGAGMQGANESAGGRIAAPGQEGWREAPGWLSKMIHRNNHPVCSALVAHAASLDRAATPPVQEGQCARPIHSHLSKETAV